jgi:uncharacterized protein YwlG (UPF0340 family)
MNVFPASLPQIMERDGFSRGYGDGRLRSPTDAGGGKSRRRFSYMPEPVKGSIVMTGAQLAIFRAFIDETLKGGTLPFYFPAQGELGQWIVKIGQAMPSEAPMGLNWRVDLDLVRLP